MDIDRAVSKVIIGSYTSYKVMPLIFIVFPITLTVLIVFIPENPYFLLKNNKKDVSTY